MKDASIQSSANPWMAQFDAVLPQGAALELTGQDGPEAWTTFYETADLAAELGYRGLWVLDRTDTMPRRELQPVLEAWTALAAVAIRRRDIALGILAPAVPARNAGLLAKQSATFDLLSDGRFALGLSAGPVLPEHDSIGLAPAAAQPEPDPDRLSALAEMCDALRALWTGQPVTKNGRWVAFKNAHCVPVPVQPRLPVTVRLEALTEGANLLPDLLVREVDVWQWTGEPPAVARAVANVARRREALGLDPAAVRHEVALECRLFETVAERDRWFATPNMVVFWSRHPDLLAKRNLYGTSEQVRSAVARYLEAGAERFVVWFRDYPNITSLRELATDVVPGLGELLAMPVPALDAAAAPDLGRAKCGFGSPAWLAAAATLEKPLPGPDTVALRLVLTDAATELDLRVDLDCGRIAVYSATGPEPGLVVRAPTTAAAALLFGPSAARVGLTERGDVTVEGNFSLLFFIDSALEEDRAGHLDSLRRAAGVDAPAPLSSSNAGPDDLERSESADRLNQVREILPRTLVELNRELGSSTPGAQLYVSRDGHTLVDAGLGLARPGIEMTHRSWSLWYCCAKPLLSVALAQLADRGLFDPYRPVSDYLPEFGANGKHSITSAQLLTHTGPVPTGADPLHGVLAADDTERRRRAYGLRLPPSDRPARSAINYSQWWAWYVLADLVAAIDGRAYEHYIESEILIPARMDLTRLRLKPEEFESVGDQLPLIHVVNTSGPPVPTNWWSTRLATTALIPGVNTRGPVRDQGRFLEVLLGGGLARDGSQVLSAHGVRDITSRHRTGVQDKFGNADWGLGLRLECHQLGEEFTSFSHYASPRTFGHEGLWTSTCFADPETGLAVAINLNGKVEHSRHRERILRIGDAIYADLGLSTS